MNGDTYRDMCLSGYISGRVHLKDYVKYIVPQQLLFVGRDVVVVWKLLEIGRLLRFDMLRSVVPYGVL